MRIIVSNIKLFSTSYVIENVKPYETLQTSLYKDNYGLFNRYGDPDLSWNDIKIYEYIFNNKINLNLIEVKEDFYWPDGWTYTIKIFPMEHLQFISISNQNLIMI